MIERKLLMSTSLYRTSLRGIWVEMQTSNKQFPLRFRCKQFLSHEIGCAFHWLWQHSATAHENTARVYKPNPSSTWLCPRDTRSGPQTSSAASQYIKMLYPSRRRLIFHILYNSFEECNKWSKVAIKSWIQVCLGCNSSIDFCELSFSHVVF